MYLDWNFYDTKLFSSDEAIVDYTGPEKGFGDLLMRPEAMLIMAVAVALLFMAVLLATWRARVRK